MQIISDEKIAEFKNFLEQHDFFYVIGHKDPDGDAIYSCMALAELLKAKNCSYQLLSAGPFKRPEIRSMAIFFSNQMTFLSEPERQKTGLIILDCSEMSRLGEIDGDLSNLDTFIIDHHKTADVTKKCIIDATSPATACLVQQIYEKILGTIPKKTAEYLFFGLSTDTGYFRFLNTDSAEVFRQAARLVESGANPRKTYDEMTGGKPYSTRKLLGIMLDRVERRYNNKLAVTYETMEDTKKWGQEGRDSDSLYSLLLSVDGIEAVLFVRQDTELTCTCGFRSRDKVDVSAIAQKFGGGGHKNAAGLSIDGKCADVLEKICAEFKKVL
ncbi:MAG: bifunctional oligoribonuclease/PAP phosphatase NrnA [Treponema sp.]|uniref:DHH family phosphoesterase n=1 Tax=Treponema sp. TaxID=166 RepID=UPI001C17E1F6|nr:bifunctional oligoribonuclease/PAP phosphatase NrnA [Treponema sp.]MBQ8680075.1 bifunctional oligoribonuclease/PAP phosphatase NrnA [Treponema sp.]MBR1535736.1 bifunctional oligoribonuclease/PAP phosphatase NrnA [Treponema sp.]